MKIVNGKQSALVEAVLKLDEHFEELERLGNKINSLDMKSQFDFDHAQRLMLRFGECGQEVSQDVLSLSSLLMQARERAEKIAAGVAERAYQLRDRKVEEQTKLEQFHLLGEKVRELTASIAQFKRPLDVELSEEDRSVITKGLAAFEDQLHPLIDEAQKIRSDARESKMKNLEQNADALTQTLQSVRQKLNGLNLPELNAH